MILNTLLGAILMATSVASQDDTCSSSCLAAISDWYNADGLGLLTGTISSNDAAKDKLCTSSFIDEVSKCGSSSFCDIAARKEYGFLKPAAELCGVNYNTSDFGEYAWPWFEGDLCSSACGYVNNGLQETHFYKSLGDVCGTSMYWGPLCASTKCTSTQYKDFPNLNYTIEYCGWTPTQTVTVTTTYYYYDATVTPDCEKRCYWAAYFWEEKGGIDMTTESGALNETARDKVCNSVFLSEVPYCGNSSFCDVQERKDYAFLKQAADICGVNYTTSDFGASYTLWDDDNFCGSVCSYVKDKYNEYRPLSNFEEVCSVADLWGLLCASRGCTSERRKNFSDLDFLIEYCSWPTYNSTSDASSSAIDSTSSPGSSSVQSSTVAANLSVATTTLMSSTNMPQTSVLKPSTTPTSTANPSSSAGSTPSSSAGSTVGSTTAPSDESSSAGSTQRPSNTTSLSISTPTASASATTESSNGAYLPLVQSMPALALGLFVGLLLMV